MARAAGRGIEFVIGADTTAFQAGLAEVRRSAKDLGAAVSQALGGAVGDRSAANNIYNLSKSFLYAKQNAAALKADLSGVESELGKAARAAGLAEQQFAGFAKSMINKKLRINFDNNFADIQRQTGATALEMTRLRASVGDTTGALRTMGQAAVGSFDKIAQMRNIIAGGLAGSALVNITRTSMQFDTFQRSFNAISGSPEGGADQMEFVRKEADRLGQDLFALADSYRGLSAAAMTSGLTQDQVRDVFSSVGEASTTLGLSSEQTKYALYALQQMMSKGVVSMEELRRQLGDALPGAFSAAARAMGMTERELIKLVESGDLLSRDFLPKFATELRRTFGAGFEDAAKSARTNFARMGNEIKEFKNNIGSGFLDEASQGALNFGEWLKENKKLAEDLGKALGFLAGNADVLGVALGGLVVSRGVGAYSVAILQGVAANKAAALAAAEKTAAELRDAEAILVNTQAQASNNQGMAAAIAEDKAMQTQIDKVTAARMRNTRAIAAASAANEAKELKDLRVVAALAREGKTTVKLQNAEAIWANTRAQAANSQGMVYSIAQIQAMQVQLDKVTAARIRNTRAVAAASAANEAMSQGGLKVAASLAKVEKTAAELRDAEAILANTRAQSVNNQTKIQAVATDKALQTQIDNVTAARARDTQAIAAASAAQNGSKALAGLKAAGAGLLGIFGGPWGLALTAGAAALYVMHDRAQEVKASINRLAEGSKNAGEAIGLTTKELEEFNKVAARAEVKRIEKDLANVETKFKAAADELRKNNNPVVKAGPRPGFYSGTKPMSEESRIAKQVMVDFNSGIITSEEAFDRLNRAIDKFGENEAFDEAKTSILAVRQGTEDLAAAQDNAAASTKNLQMSLSELANQGKSGLAAGMFDDLKKGLSALEQYDFAKKVGNFEKSRAEMKEYYNAQISDAQAFAKKLDEAMMGALMRPDSWDPGFGKTFQQFQDYQDKIKDLEKLSFDANLTMTAQFIAEQMASQDAVLANEKSTAEQRTQAMAVIAAAAVESASKAEIAMIEADLAIQRKTAEMAASAVKSFAAVAASGSTAGAVIMATLQANAAIAAGDVAKAEADLAATQERAKAAAAEAKASVLTHLKGLPGIKGSGGGGRKGDKAAKDAKEKAQALRELDLTLARMNGNLSEVAKLENLEELEHYTELVEKAGLKGLDAAAKIEAFKAAQEKKVNTDHLQEQLDFYKNLRDLMPAAGAEYERLRQQMLDMEEEQYRAININEELLASWRKWAELREATDFKSGLVVGMQDYISGLTEAKVAQDSLKTAADAFRSGLFNVSRGFESAGDAAAEFGNKVLDMFAQMIIDLYVMKPLLKGMEGLFSGGASAGGAGMSGFLGSLFGFADGGVFHSPGLKSYLNQVVTKPTVFPFAKGGALGLMGEAGSEAIMPLSRDRRGRLGVSMAADSYIPQPDEDVVVTPVVNVQVINQSGYPVTATKTEESRDSSGNLNLKLIIDQVDQGLAARENRGSSRFGNALRGKSGLNPSATLHRGGGA